MTNIFNSDKPLFKLCEKIFYLSVLNLLTIICCIPLITIGASISALYCCTFKILQDEEPHIIKLFFKSFKNNFKQSTIVHLILLLIASLLLYDLYFTHFIVHTSYAFNTVLTYCFIIFSCLYLMASLYVYPLLAKFYNSTRNILRSAFFISIRHLLYTILLLLITYFPIMLSYIYLEFLAPVLTFYTLIGISATAYFKSYFFELVFEKYL